MNSRIIQCELSSDGFEIKAKLSFTDQLKCSSKGDQA